MRQRTLCVRLYPTAEQGQILYEIRLRCARLWNRANYIIRQHYFATGKVLSYETVYHEVKNTPEYRALPTDIGQAVLKKLSEAWNSFKELKELERKRQLPEHIKKVSPPRYSKDRKKNKTLPLKFVPILAARSYGLDDYAFWMSLPQDLKNHKKDKLVLLAEHRPLKYKNCKFKRAELVCQNGKFYVHISLDVPDEHRMEVANKNPKVFASIDLGIRNMVTLAVYEGDRVKTYHFKVKELLKDWKFFEKRIVEKQSILALSGHKGPALGLRRLYEKRKLRMKVAIQAMCNQIAEILKPYADRIETVYVGDLTGIRNGKNYGKRMNKLLHNFWVRRKLLDVLEYKLEELGIGLTPIPEAHTSSFCCFCGLPIRRPYNQKAICPNCGRIHGDTVGAINILKKPLV